MDKIILITTLLIIAAILVVAFLYYLPREPKCGHSRVDIPIYGNVASKMSTASYDVYFDVDLINMNRNVSGDELVVFQAPWNVAENKPIYPAVRISFVNYKNIDDPLIVKFTIQRDATHGTALGLTCRVDKHATSANFPVKISVRGTSVEFDVNGQRSLQKFIPILKVPNGANYIFRRMTYKSDKNPFEYGCFSNLSISRAA